MAAHPYPKPGKRRLRVYAFDPAASVELETAVVNDAVLAIPWEKQWETPVGIGPSNEYLEVVDYDFPARTFYQPIDLNNPLLLAQDGLTPSEGDPQFHQQMVFAVAMNTIRNFERALGRFVFWAKPPPKDRPNEGKQTRGYASFEKRLRIYPHAIREANAYYSPQKTALLFGYFKSPPQDGVPDGQWTFTCLSQDIVAHETTHAILHGMRRRSVEPTNSDSLAFHEGFADIVALLQRFAFTSVVEHELARCGGKLRSVSLLTGLASQFGQATGRNGALRLALDTLAKETRGGEAEVKPLSEMSEAHDRGSVLVSAIFDAFVTIYERRTADLFQLAGVQPGTRGLPEHLVSRLAKEAGQVAQSVLQMCVRAIDYLPPVSPTFGEYLRAIITADFDLVPEDPHRYRVAFAEAFRKRAIPVPGCMSYAPESLRWDPPDLASLAEELPGLPEAYRDPEGLFADALGVMKLGLQFGNPPSPADQAMRSGSAEQRREASQRLEAEQMSGFADSPYREGLSAGRRGEDHYNLRVEAMRIVSYNQERLHAWLEEPSREAPNSSVDRLWEQLLGIRMMPLLKSDKPPLLSINWRREEWPQGPPLAWTDARKFPVGTPRRTPIFDVHSVRLAHRYGPDGNEMHQVIAQVTQKRRAYFTDEDQTEADHGRLTGEPDFWFRGGATIIVDMRNGSVQHMVRKRIDDDDRLKEQRAFLLGDEIALAMGDRDSAVWREPFSFMHGDEV